MRGKPWQMKNSLEHKRLWDDPVYARVNRRRTGVPTGMTKDIVKRFHKQARFEAAMEMKKLENAGVLDGEDGYAKEALKTAISLLRNGLVNHKDKLTAARLVLDFTKAKPASKSEVTVNKAEEWLAAVTASNEKADEGDAGDAEASAE